MNKKALILINPKSRSGGDGRIDQCIAKLRSGGLDLESYESQSPADANLAIEERAPQLDIVVVAGGDGSISNVVETVQRRQLTLAVLPFGTANDLARSLHLPQDPLEACDVILNGVLAPIDLGRVNGRVFFNAAHMGLGVKVTHELSPEVKKKWGVLSYVRAFIKAVGRLDSFTVDLKLDGKRLRLRAVHVGVGNGRYYGGGNVIDQSCFINDGKLSLFLLKPQTLWDLVTLAPLLRTGTQRLAKRTYTARANKIEVRTRRTLEVHADGEPITHTPAEFELMPSVLRVICAAGALDLDENLQQPVVKMMEWLKSEQEVLVSDLLIAAQESVDFYLDAAKLVHDERLKHGFESFAERRKRMADAIEAYLESRGDLSVMPDPDSEWGAKLLKHMELKLSSDEDKTLIEQRLKGEQDIAELIADANNVDLDENFKRLLRDFAIDNDAVLNELKALLKAHFDEAS